MATGPSHRTPGTLPPETSGFVGREAELARARELLRQSRLVTVTGPGGVGKTCFAVRAADAAAGGFRDGAAFVELSAVNDPGLLEHTVAARLNIAELANAELDQGSARSRLLGFLRERELLLILDTCEHVIDACAELADGILHAAPGVTVLATSRQPLDAAGEAVLQLAPLPVPDPGAAAAGKSDAVELFAQRAAATVPGFTVTPENLADVVWPRPGPARPGPREAWLPRGRGRRLTVQSLNRHSRITQRSAGRNRGARTVSPTS